MVRKTTMLQKVRRYRWEMHDAKKCPLNYYTLRLWTTD